MVEEKKAVEEKVVKGYTGLGKSGFAKVLPKVKGESEKNLAVRQQRENDKSKEQIFKERGIVIVKEKPVVVKNITQKVVKQPRPKDSPLGVMFSRLTGTSYSKFGRPKARAGRLSDRMRIARLRHMLEKRRLINTIEKLKLQKQYQNFKLTKGGTIVPTVPQIQIRQQPQRFYPIFTTPELNKDIDSMYADIGHGDILWGGEDYFGGENYHDENYMGDEFNFGDAWTQLGIKPSRANPLLW